MRGTSTLTRRLIGSHAVVILTMAVAMVVVAAVVGPAVFDHHMHQAGHGNQPVVLLHAEQAFRSAGMTSVLVGLAVAFATAMTASILLARRIGRGLDALAAGAARVAEGDYESPVDLPSSSPELQPVADAFNAMAHDIAATETTRRRLLTDLGHELRTPLAVIDVTLEGIEDGVLTLDDATLRTLREHTRRLERLAHDVKEVSAAEEGRLSVDPRPTPLDVLVDAAAATARAGYGAQGVTLDVDVPDVDVLADPTRVGQVLDNLLRNALQHTPSGGRVRIGAVPTSDDVAIRVSDNGSGIEARHLPHLFERFYRADPGRRHDSSGGTGVGLAIALAIARAHGGSLSAESAGAGRGATFTLTLPRV